MEISCDNGFHIRECTGPQLRVTLENVGFEVPEFGGQNYIPNKLVFWPLQVLLKGSGYALRQFGGGQVGTQYLPSQ